MDPVNAFSLAVNVFTMVDIAVKTGKTLWELYKSSSGLTKQAEDLGKATTDFETALAALNDAQAQFVSLHSTDIDKETVRATEKCVEAAHAIKMVLDDCKTSKQSMLAAMKALFRFKAKKNKLEELQAALERAKDALQMALAMATR